MSKKKTPMPEDYTEGTPSRTETGNYFVNDQTTPMFWDGKLWHRATKDIDGGLNWHESIGRQPKVKFHKLINYVCIQK